MQCTVSLRISFPPEDPMAGLATKRRGKRSFDQVAEDLQTRQMDQARDQIMQELDRCPAKVFPCLSMVMSDTLLPKTKKDPTEQPFPDTYVGMERIPADFLKERLLQKLDPRFVAPALKSLKDKNMMRAAFYYACKLEPATRVPKKCLGKSVFIGFAVERHQRLGKPLSQVQFSPDCKELLFGNDAGYYILEPKKPDNIAAASHRYTHIVHQLSTLRRELIGEVTGEWIVDKNWDEDKATLKKGMQTQSCMEYFRNQPTFEAKRGERNSESVRILVDELYPDGGSSSPQSFSGIMTPSPARPRSAGSTSFEADVDVSVAPPERPMPGATVS